MKKELSIRRVFIDSLVFIGNNLGLLAFLAFLSFAGSYIALAAGTASNLLYLIFYGAFIYGFYFLFVALYFGKKPLFTAERFVNSFLKLLVVLGLSFVILIICRCGFNVLRHLAGSLIVFPDFYEWLRTTYHYVLSTGIYSVVAYLSIIGLLSLSFFIPGFAWMATIDDQSGSIIRAYAEVRGNYFKTLIVFELIYGILPLIFSLAGLMTSKTVLSALYALQTVFQLVVYLRLYEVFYAEHQEE